MQEMSGWIWALLGVSIALAAVAAILLVKLRRQEAAPPEQPAPPTPAPEPSATGEDAREAEARHQERLREACRSLEQCWFVVFDAPSAETSRRLAELLEARNAFYDAELGVYYITSSSARYQLTIAHSSSPGRLPPLHQQADAEVDGISVLIKFLNKRSVARHPDTFIDVVMAAQRIGGRILDAERQPLSVEAFRQRFDIMPAP
ncbi:MAG: hypothetical protein ACOC0M_10975 [Halomonas sp.]